MRTKYWMIFLSSVLTMVVCVGCNLQNSVTGSEITQGMTTESETIEPATTELATTVASTTAAVKNYSEYPVYVRTMGVGSVGCEYGYCKLGEKSVEEILDELSGFSSFFNSPEHSDGVALYYDEEPQNIKLYHALAGSTEYEEYEFEGEDYNFPWNVEPMKYVICVPEEYGMHYFFAVITWVDGEKDLMYFSMEYAVRESNNMGVYKDFYNWLVMNYCWPGGEKLAVGADGDVLNGFEPEGNSYAIYDIDKDGRKEIIVNYSTTYSAGMITRIYEYDKVSGEYVKQFGNFVSNTYYDNGIIKVDWSHNHSNGEAIWPFDLYCYNSETDSYDMIASACSEDKAWIQDKFDDLLDTDGDGVLYLVQENAYGDGLKVMNKTEYDMWISGYIGDAREINVPWKQIEFVKK